MKMMARKTIARIVRNLKVIIIIVFILEIIGWVARGGGKYDQVNYRLGGFEAEQFTVGDTNEEIEVRLNISGRNWELDFDEEEELILVSKDGETILEGCFISSEDFELWEDDFLHAEQYTVIETDSESPRRFYFCSADEGWYVFLKKIDRSDYSIIFFSSEDTEISQDKALDTFQRITVKASL